jgi:glycosyltransferase involved in cell wall biosynthesis
MTAIVQLSILLKKRGVDLIHLNEMFDFYGGAAAALARVPCVWNVRAGLTTQDPVARWAPLVVSKWAKQVIAESESVGRELFFSNGIQDNVEVIHPPGPPLEQFHPGVSGSKVRNELGLNPTDPMVTLVAKLAPRKGHKTFIQAAAVVARRFPDAKFVIVGGELPGPRYASYARELERLREKLQLDDKVVFLGYREDVPQIMAASTVIAHCSLFPDPFPGVVLQGMAIGRPVVASDLGGPKEQLIHGETGFLCEPGTEQQLADLILLLLAQPALGERIGSKAAAFVRERHSMDAYLSKLDGVYRRLLDLS